MHNESNGKQHPSHKGVNGVDSGGSVRTDGKTVLRPAYLLRLLFSGVSPKGRRQLGVVGLFPFSRRYDVDASVRVATAYRLSTNANENHLHFVCNCGIMISTKTTCARTKPLRGATFGIGVMLEGRGSPSARVVFRGLRQGRQPIEVVGPFLHTVLPFYLYVPSPFR